MRSVLGNPTGSSVERGGASLTTHCRVCEDQGVSWFPRPAFTDEAYLALQRAPCLRDDRSASRWSRPIKLSCQSALVMGSILGPADHGFRFKFQQRRPRFQALTGEPHLSVRHRRFRSHGGCADSTTCQDCRLKSRPQATASEQCAEPMRRERGRGPLLRAPRCINGSRQQPAGRAPAAPSRFSQSTILLIEIARHL